MIIAFLLTLLLGSILTHLFDKTPAEPLLDPYNGTTFIQSGMVLGVISSLLSEKETILWEESQRLEYDYDILYDLWNCESQNRHEGVWGDNYQSYGGFQWQLPSWVMYNRIFETELNILSFKDQVEMTIMVLKKNEWTNWFNCLKGIKGSW